MSGSSKKEKAAHNMRERNKIGGGTADIVALSQVEQAAMEISGTSRAISIGDGEAGGFSKHSDCFPVLPIHVPQVITTNFKISASPPEPQQPPQEAFEEDTVESDSPPEGVQSVAASLQSSNAEIPAPDREESELERPVPDETHSQRDQEQDQEQEQEREQEQQQEQEQDQEQEQALVVGTGQEVSRRRAMSSPSSAEWDRDTDLRDPAIKRKMLEAHHRLYEVLEGLPKTLSAMSESMEESTSAMCGVVSHVVSTLQTTLESTTTSRDTMAEPSQQESASPTIEALIGAQTATIQTLGSNVCSTLERLVCQMDSLVGHVDRGFQRVTHLLQSALPQISGSEETKPHGSNGSATGQASVTLVHKAFALSPPPQPMPAMVPNNQLGLTALAAAKVLQSVAVPLRARAPRGQRPRATQGSQDQPQQPTTTCSAVATGGASRRSSKVGLSH
ncbi:ataxin-2 homolog isoform X2 [Heterodontus francisci]|uniref:ataxin-2 homolog isoform X2 n=1 Tax=Heterodontus francisci TaxID=7792 RepID=UPI00355B8184